MRKSFSTQGKTLYATTCFTYYSLLTHLLHTLFRIMSNYDEHWCLYLAYYFHRYYFVVEEDNTPLSVTVTPCDAPLEWKLTLQELPEDASGGGSGITDIRQQWKRLITRYLEI